MKRLTVLAPILICCLSLACSNSNGKSDSDGQADYMDGGLRLFEFCGSDDPELVPADAAVELDELAERFDELDPPDEMKSAHDRYVEANRETADVLRSLSSDETPSEADENVAEEFVEASEAFAHAFRDYYSLEPYFRNEGASMEPALSAGDVVVLNPFDGELERGDIVVFEFPLDRERLFLKRVIGLPGETVEVKEEQVFINNLPLLEDYIPESPNYTYGPVVVPEDSYFVLGDNRRNSYDSHA